MKKILMFTVSFLIGLLIGYGVLLGVQRLLDPIDDRHAVHKHTVHKQQAPTIEKKGGDMVDLANKDAQALLEKFDRALNGKSNIFIDYLLKKLFAFVSKTLQNLTFVSTLYAGMVGMFALVFATAMGSLLAGMDHALLRRLSGWATVLPPMFGVAGTMAALAAFAGVDPSRLAEAFRINVGDAVGTTIVGIAFYTLNLLLLTLMPGGDDAPAT